MPNGPLHRSNPRSPRSSRLVAWIFLAASCRATPTTATGPLAFGLPASPVRSVLLRARRNHRHHDENDDDDDDPPEVDVANFRAPSSASSFGWNRGRSSPSVRKAMGTPKSSAATVFVCTNCGSESVQWRGRCPTCREWNTLQEFVAPREAAGGGMSPSFGSKSPRPAAWLDGIGEFQAPVPVNKVDLESPTHQRILVPGDDELNGVLGGGLLKGSLVLLGGDPGVGKSTLALQAANAVASLSSAPVGIGMGPVATGGASVGPVWYASGEETLAQIATRAQRLAAVSDRLLLLSETNMDALAERVVRLTDQQRLLQEQLQQSTNSTDRAEADLEDRLLLEQNLPPSLLVVDSIQTVTCDAAASGSPGGVSQVRESMALLLRLAKSTGVPILVIGHVTKTGDVAGPRMVEHMVDAVLYLESFSSTSSSSEVAPYRWLRASKNRFGSTQAVGLYEFASGGRLVPNPELEGASTLPLEDLEGCAMSVVLEGSQRTLTVECQALVTLSNGSFGKKTVDGGGLSHQRLQLLLGVLQKHCGLSMGKTRDVYVNVVGCGSSRDRRSATALDLAVAVALVSSFVSIPVRGDTAFLAQVGLLGELRSLGNIEAQLLQAERMGFSRVVVAGRRFKERRQHGMDLIECPSLQKALEVGLVASIPLRSRRGGGSSARKPKGGVKKGAAKPETPGSLEDIGFGEIILDDDDDDYEEDTYFE